MTEITRSLAVACPQHGDVPLLVRLHDDTAVWSALSEQREPCCEAAIRQVVGQLNGVRSSEEITGINIAAPPGTDGAVHGPPTLPRIPGACPKCGERNDVPSPDPEDQMTYCAHCGTNYDDTTGGSSAT